MIGRAASAALVSLLADGRAFSLGGADLRVCNVIEGDRSSPTCTG